jgi:hypothetical protein
MADWMSNQFKEFLTDGVINLQTDTFRCMLIGSNYTPNSSTTHSNSIGAFQTSGTAYSSGGVAMTGVATTLSGGVVKWDADDAVWSGASFSADYAIVVSATASGWPIVGGWDFTARKTVSSGNFTVQWNAAGLINLT